MRGGGSRSCCWPVRSCASTGSNQPKGATRRLRASTTSAASSLANWLQAAPTSQRAARSPWRRSSPVACRHEPAVDARAARVLQGPLRELRGRGPSDGGLYGHQAGHQRPDGLRDTHGPGDPQALGPDAGPGRNGAPAPQRNIQLAAGCPAGPRYPARPGRVGSQPCPGLPLAHRRPVPPARLAGRVSAMGHRPVPSCRGTGDGLALGAHCKEDGLVPHRARIGRPGVFAQ
jgi:hypothetical protein